MASRLRTSEVKRFLRSSIELIFGRNTQPFPINMLAIVHYRWGREFIERIVIPDSIKKNEQWEKEGKTENHVFLWIHHDAPVLSMKPLGCLVIRVLLHKWTLAL